MNFGKKLFTCSVVLILLSIMMISVLTGCGNSGSKSTTVVPAGANPNDPGSELGENLDYLEITPGRTKIAKGTNLQYSVTAVYTDGTTSDVTAYVRFSSSNERVATISNKGLANGLKKGETVITAWVPDTKIKVRTTLLVTNAVLKKLEVEPLSSSLPIGLTQQFTASGYFSDGSVQDLTMSVFWGSSNKNLAEISNKVARRGLLIAKEKGNVTITASFFETEAYAYLNVIDAELKSMEVVPASASIPKGTFKQFAVLGTFSDGATRDLTSSVTWSSSNTVVATISNDLGETGKARGLDVGTATITATAPSGLTAQGQLDVTAAELTAITVEPNSPGIPAGLTQQFIARGTYSDGTIVNITDSVVWSSSNPAVAAISNTAPSQGLAQALAEGETVISATKSGITGQTKLNVSLARLVTLEVSPTQTSIGLEKSRQFIARGIFTDGSIHDVSSEVLWATSNPMVAYVSNYSGSQGVVLGVNPHLGMDMGGMPMPPVPVRTATITATYQPTGATVVTQVSVAPILDPMTLTKYIDPLPLPAVAQPVSGTNYEIAMTEFTQQLHSQLPPTRVWGYNGSYPGPTIEAQTGTPVTVKWTNSLPSSHLLPLDTSVHGAEPDKPEVRSVVHLHGGFVPPDVDGYPEAWYTAGNQKVGPTFTTDTYAYPNLQQAATLWYHDHALGITRLNVYAGLAGFYILRDAFENSLNLPSGAYEIPIVIQDRRFLTDGALDYPGDCYKGLMPSIEPEAFGDTILVNGKVWPFLAVEPRKYRFRFLNGSTSRFYKLQLSSGQQFIQIGTDGGLLPAPVYVNELTMAPGERCDLILDFTGHDGEMITITNTAPTPYPDGDPVDPNTTGQIMQFQVTQALQGADTSVIPAILRPITWFNEVDAVLTRDNVLVEMMDFWGRMMPMLNGMKWDDPITETPVLNTIEIWRFINMTPDTHPMHLHLVQFQPIDRQPFDVDMYNMTGNVVFTGPAEPVADNERGWKDTIQCPPGMVTRFITRFEGWPGVYVWHCHILEHEDYEMMRPYEVLPAP